MANPVTLPEKKVQDVDSTTLTTSVTKKRTLAGENEMEDHHKPTKLSKFQAEALEENVDYITLQSTLSLLQSRLSSIKRDVIDLNSLKKSISESPDIKSLQHLILHNKSYLKEISYKGVCVKCPSIQWDQNYGLKLELLNDDNETHEKINESYEIIRRDKLFH